MRESRGRDVRCTQVPERQEELNSLREGTPGCLQAQRLWELGAKAPWHTKAPGHSSQLTAATGDPQLHRQKGHCQNWDIITSPSKRIFWLSLLCFLLNNWPPFCRKTKQQTNPYRQYILKRSAVSLPCSSLFQHHIMKSPQYRLKKPTQTTTTINQTKNNPH